MRRSAWAGLFTALLGLSALGLTTTTTVGCPTMDTCLCLLCESAINLAVVEDGTEVAVNDFFVEVIIDGAAMGEPVPCRTNFREDNLCSFGTDTGVYVIIISAPGYETLEVSARVAAEGESSLCCRACLSGKDVRAKLTPNNNG